MKFTIKKALSLLLTLAVLSSLCVIPASAAGGLTLEVASAEQNGSTVTADVVASCGEDFGVTNADIQVTFDTEYLEFDGLTSKFGSADANAVDGVVYISVAGSGGNPIAASDKQLVVGTLTFKVKQDAEGSKTVAFGVNKDDINIKDDSTKTTFSVDSTPESSLKVTGNPPTVKSVELTDSSLEVDGKSNKTTKVTVTSTKDADITDDVTWSVSPSGEGVTVSGGTVTVDAKAKKGTYVITAVSGDSSKTAELTVTRAPAVITSVEIDGSKTIALSNENGNTYSAVVKDQYGDEANEAITWALSGSDAAVAALSATAGKSVTVTLKADAEDGDAFTLTATAGGVSTPIDIKVIQGTVFAVAERWTGDDGSRIYIAIEDIDHANNIRDLYLDDVLPSRVSVTYPGGETDFSSQYRVKWSSTRLWELFKDLRSDWTKMSGNKGYYAVPNLGYYIESDGTEDTPVEIDYSNWFSLIIDEGSAEASGWYEEENTYVPPAASAGFTDVAPGYWAAEDINWCFAKKVMLGNSATTFNPAGVTSRQQLWMVLARVNGSAPDSMATARTWAINMGVSDGTNVSGSLTRQQMVAMLYRYSAIKGYAGKAGTGLAGFTDAGSVSAYAQEAMSWAVANGIITGNDGRLNPNGTATRAQFAAIMHRFCDTFKVI